MARALCEKENVEIVGDWKTMTCLAKKGYSKKRKGRDRLWRQEI